MPVSSNTLFHFTDNVENLENILTNKFKPRFCLEPFLKTIFPPKTPESFEMAIPMVCFCDIPLSKVKNHLKDYGPCGIGLTKQWGKKNGINPMLYLTSKATLKSKLKTIFDNAVKRNEMFFEMNELISMIKPYRGPFKRKNVTKQKTFYNEREWRYIPPLDPFSDNIYRLSKSHFENKQKLADANKKIARTITLDFDIRDIQYLIVNRGQDILPLIKKIEKIFKKTHHDDDINILKSKIITTTRIRNDF